MPRSRGRKSKPKQSKLPATPPVKSRLLSVVCSLLSTLARLLASTVLPTWHALVSASVVVGLVVGYLVLWPPRLLVEPLGPFDSSDPLSATFLIKNGWLLSLRDVVPFVGVCTFDVAPGFRVQGNCADRGAARFVMPFWKSRDLDVDDRFTIALADVLNTPAASFAGGDITVGARFKPWLWPRYTERMFRFVAKKQRDGKYVWVPDK